MAAASIETAEVVEEAEVVPVVQLRTCRFADLLGEAAPNRAMRKRPEFGTSYFLLLLTGVAHWQGEPF